MNTESLFSQYERIELAKSMLQDNYPIPSIARVTQLSENDIINLK